MLASRPDLSTDCVPLTARHEAFAHTTTGGYPDEPLICQTRKDRVVRDGPTSDGSVVSPRRAKPCGAVLAAALVLAAPVAGPTLDAQTTGRIVGRVREVGTHQPVGSADVRVEGLPLSTLTSDQGYFVLVGVPVGIHTLQIERLGLRAVRLEDVRVRAGRATEVVIDMETAPVQLEGVTAEVERAPLIEPAVSASHETVVGRELRELPVDRVEEAIELTTGVTDGHFRGGRVGQETYRIDGLDIKNQFSASTTGPLLEISPTALEEVDVITGGLGAESGDALSGVVSYSTRRGNPEHWEGRGSLTTDYWAPNDLFRGFTGLSLSAGGPVPFLGSGATLFADLLAQGMLDADPRARGLSCVRPGDADPALADAIRNLADDPATAHLYCPYSGPRLPYQRGDKVIGFLRLDRPLGVSTNLTLTVLRNRHQQELYTPEFKYNPTYQLGQRAKGTLVNLLLDWTHHRQGSAYHITARAAGLHLDRYLGVVDPWTFDARSRIAGFGFRDFRFLGERFVHRPVEEQLKSGRAVPGYQQPGGSTGSPFGPAAEGIFSTEGTPQIANWSRSDFIGGDLVGELLSARGHALRAGGSLRLYRAESYERTLAYLPGSAPNYARFYPATASAFVDASLAAADQVTIDFGVRLESFRSGLSLQRNRANVFAPTVTTGWNTELLPRIGVAVPVPGSEDRTMFRFNYTLVAQPPDFQFFLDTTIGDSLRVDIRRQGNPDLTFERGSAYELGLTHLLSPNVAIGGTAFLKELTNLVTGSLGFVGYAQNEFTTGDFGSVKGLELYARGRWPGLQFRAGYSLQSAKGVTSGALDTPEGPIVESRREFPLAFDRRHSADLTVLVGRAGGDVESPWSIGLTSSLRSGFPLDRLQAAGDVAGATTIPDRLPWTWVVDLRVARELGRPPLCDGCTWRLAADARNLLGRDNIVALRRDTGRLAPGGSDLTATAQEIPDDAEPIPIESPRYSAQADLNGDGLVTAAELRTVRFAAALDRADPSLFFGPARELRLGVEVAF